MIKNFETNKELTKYISNKKIKILNKVTEGTCYLGEDNKVYKLLELDNVIISTGGGVIKNKAHKELMNGKCIYLDVDLETLDKRLQNSDTIRPLLQTKTVYTLYEERKDLYDYFADYKIKNNDINEAINNILEVLK